jgi:hypothetical protein
MTGIQFVTDDKGRRVAVQIDLKTHGAIWEDFWDGLISESRRGEKKRPVRTVSHTSAEARRATWLATTSFSNRLRRKSSMHSTTVSFVASTARF